MRGNRPIPLPKRRETAESSAAMFVVASFLYPGSLRENVLLHLAENSHRFFNTNGKRSQTIQRSCKFALRVLYTFYVKSFSGTVNATFDVTRERSV